MPLGDEDKKTLRLLLVIVAGFLVGMGFLLFIIVTDLGG